MLYSPLCLFPSLSHSLITICLSLRGVDCRNCNHEWEITKPAERRARERGKRDRQRHTTKTDLGPQEVDNRHSWRWSWRRSLRVVLELRRQLALFPTLSLFLFPFLILCSAVATGAMLLLRCLLLFCFWLFFVVFCSHFVSCQRQTFQ